MKLLTPEEVAEILDMHEETIRKFCREGRIPCKKVFNRWKIDEEELNEWIKKQ